jgi:GT2 family glycosyltransferase
MTALPVSVVVPTVGRATLRACLESVAACDPAPAEVLVVDQSPDAAGARAADGLPIARHLPCAATGPGASRNAGVRAAAHDHVLMTDDDCTVARDWVAAGHALMQRHPDALLTGRVLPAGPHRPVPSTVEDAEPRDLGGRPRFDALYSNNMAIGRAAFLAVGGFDERLPTAEDNDLCYRWTSAGRPMRYEPSLTVWHHGWRGPAELERVWLGYWRGQGAFYAKHLRRGDRSMLRAIARDLVAGVRATVARRPRWSDSRRSILRGLPAGLADGWRRFGR